MSGIAEGNVTIVAPIAVDVVIGDDWQTGETEDDLAGNTRCMRNEVVGDWEIDLIYGLKTFHQLKQLIRLSSIMIQSGVRTLINNQDYS